jgi:hypothetical protein
VSGNYFAQAEPSQGIFATRILAKIVGSKFNTTLGTTFQFCEILKPGWCRMVQDGAGWCRMVQDGSGWFWMVVDGFDHFASVLEG